MTPDELEERLKRAETLLSARASSLWPSSQVTDFCLDASDMILQRPMNAKGLGKGDYF